MNEQDLREKIKTTMLIPEEIKEKILAARWDENLMSKFNQFFEEYGNAEEETLKVISANIPNVFLKAVQTLEAQYKEEVEKPELKQIEEKIQNV